LFLCLTEMRLQTYATGLRIKTKTYTTLKFSYILCLITFLLSCSNEISSVSPVPDVNVREEVSLNSVAAQPLKVRDGNFILIPGGISGIIVYRKTADVYLAFERKSPYKMDDPCGVITVPSSQFYLEDTCHKCTFNWEGRPTGGPCQSVLKQYTVQYTNAYTLLITNP
jgi:hypothetical protein